MPDPLVDINFIELEYPTAREDTMPERTDFTALKRSLYAERKLYENEEPITDPKEALPLLANPNPFGGRWASARLYDGGPHEPFIEILYTGREYENGGRSRYLVDVDCLNEIVKQAWVEGIPKWGYTDMTQFRISPRGEKKLAEWQKEAEECEGEEACRLIRASVPGSGFVPHGRSLVSRTSSPSGIDTAYVFSTASGERYHVFVKERAILKVHKDELC